ncbi:hypothetical protein D3C71_911200 [compost metagenome]
MAARDGLSEGVVGIAGGTAQCIRGAGHGTRGVVGMKDMGVLGCIRHDTELTGQGIRVQAAGGEVA